MKRFSVIAVVMFAFMLLAGCVSLPMTGGADTAPGWGTDWNKALQTATQKNLKVLAMFTGAAEWCEDCQQFDQEVLLRPEFLEFARDKFVLVRIYLAQPDVAQLTPLQQELVAKYGIKTVPAVILLTSEGKHIAARSGYYGEGAAVFQELIVEQMSKYEAQKDVPIIVCLNDFVSGGSLEGVAADKIAEAVLHYVRESETIAYPVVIKIKVISGALLQSIAEEVKKTYPRLNFVPVVNEPNTYELK